MNIIDPLRTKIGGLLASSSPAPLNQARAEYGTEDDIFKIVKTAETINDDCRPYTLVDLTPFERVGHVDLLVDKLSSVNGKIPVVMVMEDNLLRHLKGKDGSYRLPVAQFSPDGSLLALHGHSGIPQALNGQLIKDLRPGGNLTSLRKLRAGIAERILLNLIYEAGCLDIPTEDTPAEERAWTSGRYYRKMPNGMLVSCYLNLKALGKNPCFLLGLAYEIVLVLTDFFRRDKNPADEYDFIVVPNNTALFLTATVQSILKKPVVAIDRLGPIPTMNFLRPRLKEQLKRKRVVLIEEVVATGNEVDRSLLFLSGVAGAKVTKVLALYNLDVGMPMLASDEDVFSLCHPKGAILYEYRSQ